MVDFLAGEGLGSLLALVGDFGLRAGDLDAFLAGDFFAGDLPRAGDFGRPRDGDFDFAGDFGFEGDFDLAGDLDLAGDFGLAGDCFRAAIFAKRAGDLRKFLSICRKTKYD